MHIVVNRIDASRVLSCLGPVTGRAKAHKFESARQAQLAIERARFRPGAWIVENASCF